MNETKVNQLARKMGVILCESGMRMIRSAFSLKPEMRRFWYLEKFFKEQGIKARLNPADNDFYFTNWETMKKIIEVDWISQKKYVKEKFDCEDFAYAFKSHLSEIYGLNGIGVSHGHCYDLTGKWKYGHFWIVLPTIDNGKFNLHWLESINDKWVEHKIGRKIIIGATEYRPLSIRF